MPRKKAAPATAAPESPHQAAIASASVIEAPGQELKGPATAESVPIDPEVHIVINGKIYERETFTSEQVQAISLVNFADQQLATAQQNLTISKLGRDALVEKLLGQIEEVPFVGVTEEPVIE
jgi:hypothetical protein